MGGSTDRNDDIELGTTQGMWNSAASDTSSSKPKRKKDKADTVPIEPNYQPINWKRVFLTPKYIPVWIVMILVGILTAVITLKHDQVVAALRPFAEKVRNIPAGWLIFVAVLFVISFPPLFGHELVALLAGVVYGLWIGFAVVSAGTFIGEIGTWFAFKKAFRRKAEKMEMTNLTYGSMARLCREGGFWIVLIIRLSIIPSHMSTAVFSTCDVKFWRFAVSTFLTLPKQLILVYLGVLLVQEQDDSVIKDALFAVAGLVTVAAAVWIWFKMKKYKTQLLEEQAQRQQRKEAERLALTRSDSGYAPSGNVPDQDAGTMPMPTMTTTTTMPSPTLNHGPWRQGDGFAGAAAQPPEPPRYEPYRPQYGSPTTAYGQYGHYEQDNFYHGNNDSGDVGTALTHPTAYGLPGPVSQQFDARPADTISVDAGRPAQNHHFV
ncbi:Golgi apparatus membrane protein TVP38 [Cytospora mali]|uniref:Golgi apparatus membrane protein TVP38 n=1 Tax=Cytospora mali TaxID=578113 RepID=A0A194W3P7_CYTMA|nr:Golgi apparatus membrane protein TVP38 [Valsa mali]